MEWDGSSAKQVKAVQKKGYDTLEEQLGVYFIRTSLNPKEEETLQTIYNTIKEIENTFRSLKTDLDLRPIYHKNDDFTLAHLHLGLLAYWVVNIIRYQLKAKGINSAWQEIIRITNTQKIVTTTGQNSFDQTIQIRRCSQPNTEVEKVYSALGYKNYPFVKRKYVVPKSELKKNDAAINQAINDSQLQVELKLRYSIKTKITKMHNLYKFFIVFVRNKKGAKVNPNLCPFKSIVYSL